MNVVAVVACLACVALLCTIIFIIKRGAAAEYNRDDEDDIFELNKNELWIVFSIFDLSFFKKRKIILNCIFDE
mgnify:FL=1